MGVQRKAPPVDIMLDGRNLANAQLLEAHRSQGLHSPDTVRFELRAAGQSAPVLENTRLDGLPNFSNSLCEIFVKTKLRAGVGGLGPGRQRIHYGRLCAVEVGFDAEGEFVIYESRYDSDMLGRPLAFRPTISWPQSVRPNPQAHSVLEFSRIGRQHLVNTIDGDLVAARDDWEFNPLVDGERQPNCYIANATHKTPALLRANTRPFVDANSLPALNATAPTWPWAELWTLATALPALVNWHGEHLEPLTREQDIEQQLGQDFARDPSVLTGVRIPLGTTLAEALTQLLDPLGVGWHLDYGGAPKPRIRFTRYDTAGRFKPRLQRRGQVADDTRSTVDSLRIKYDLHSRSLNAVQVVPGQTLRESTFELIPAWEAKYDTYTAAQLAKSSEEYQNDPPARRAFREFVLNETFSYGSLRPAESLFAGAKTFNALNALFGLGKWIRRRREFLPCVFKDNAGYPIGEHKGTVIEFWDRFSSTWKNVSELTNSGSIQLLTREAGIRFDGENIPLQLKDAFSTGLAYCKVRITASLATDDPVLGAANQRPVGVAVDPVDGTHLEWTKQIVIDGRQRFNAGEVSEGSIHFSQLSLAQGASPAALHSTWNNLNEAADLAQQILDSQSHAAGYGTLTLPGIDFSDVRDSLGQVMVGIADRDIDFNLSKQGRRYPTIRAVSWNNQSQETTLHLDTSFANFRGGRGRGGGP